MSLNKNKQKLTLTLNAISSFLLSLKEKNKNVVTLFDSITTRRRVCVVGAREKFIEKKLHERDRRWH